MARRTTTKLGRDLRVGDEIVYGETVMGRLRTAEIRGIRPAGRYYLALALAGAGDMTAATNDPYRVVVA